jgi:WD40 repeat protein
MGTHAVTGSVDGSIRVGPITGEEPHLLLGQSGWIKVAVHPDGGSIVAAGDESLRVWPWPEGRPLHALPYEEFLARLGSLTNFRVARDDTTITGYRLEVGPFPGWEKTPTW